MIIRNQYANVRNDAGGRSEISQNRGKNTQICRLPIYEEKNIYISLLIPISMYVRAYCVLAYFTQRWTLRTGCVLVCVPGYWQKQKLFDARSKTWIQQK